MTGPGRGDFSVAVLLAAAAPCRLMRLLLLQVSLSNFKVVEMPKNRGLGALCLFHVPCEMALCWEFAYSGGPGGIKDVLYERFRVGDPFSG